jgi:tetratricopeptide (TPR) repeat protein
MGTSGNPAGHQPQVGITLEAMKPRLIASVCLLNLFGAHAVLGCAWDRDTALAEARLARDAKGRFDVIAAIVGIFDRNPPLYYQMRLERVRKEIKSQPDNLGLYDDAGVACDRLGKSDEAIEWMNQKQRQMDRLEKGVSSQDRYRQLANLGTFYAHRWIKRPDCFDKREDLEKAIQYVNKAIVENPAAHFNREVYQLAFLKWLNAAGRDKGDPKSPLQPMGRFFEVVTQMQRERNKPMEPMDACDGLAGLVQLGAAWESTDVFVLLTEGLNRADKWSMAELAQMRVQELIRAGKGSVYPAAYYKSRVREDRVIPPHVTEAGVSQLERFFNEARDAVKKREAERAAYMKVRLEQGQHPDTNVDFWKDWQEPVMPRYPN